MPESDTSQTYDKRYADRTSPSTFAAQKNLSVKDLRDKAGETGPKTFEVIRRMSDEAKVKEQPLQTAGAILSIVNIYTPEVLEKACDKALKQHHMPYYKTIYSHARSINSAKELTEFKESNQKFGIVRGADYYKKGEKCRKKSSLHCSFPRYKL